MGHGGGPLLGCCCSGKTQKDSTLLLGEESSRVTPMQSRGLPFQTGAAGKAKSGDNSPGGARQLHSTCCLAA